jgi:hypothetical protein
MLGCETEEKHGVLFYDNLPLPFLAWSEAWALAWAVAWAVYSAFPKKQIE